MKRIKKILIFTLGFILIAYLLGYRFSSEEYKLDNYPTIFAHRGIKNYCVENSLESFTLAEKLGFKAIEIDISVTKDNYPVIFHDDNCKRLIGIDTSIEKVNLDFLKDKHLIYKGQETENNILLVSDFVKNIQKEKTIYFDIKTPSKQLADTLISLLNNNKKYSTSLIADDNIFFLGYLKFKNPKIRTILEGYNKGKEFLYYLIPHKYRPDFYSSFFHEVDNNHIKFLKNNNLIQNKIVYGIDKSNLDTLINTGIKNIIIDFDSSMINNTHLINKLNNTK